MPTDLCTLVPDIDYLQQTLSKPEQCKLDAIDSGSTGGYVSLRDEGRPVNESNPGTGSAEVTTSEIGGRTVYFWNRTNTEINAVFNTGSTSLWLRVVAFKDAEFMRGSSEAIVAYAIQQLGGGTDAAAGGDSAAPKAPESVPNDLCTLLTAPAADMTQQPGDPSLRCAYSNAEQTVTLLNSGFPVREQDPSSLGLPVEAGTIGERPVWSWIDNSLSNHTGMMTFNVADTSLTVMVSGGTDDAALLAAAKDVAEQVIGKLGG